MYLWKKAFKFYIIISILYPKSWKEKKKEKKETVALSIKF